METIWLSKEEFDALPEYSYSNPTGVIIGKKWKRAIGDRWYLCQYEADENKDYALVTSKKIIRKMETLEEVKFYLDECIIYWRNKRDSAESIEARIMGAHYVDAFQSARESIFGELLPE